MKQQTLQFSLLPIVETTTGEQSGDLLVRLWNEAERTIVTQRPPAPPRRNLEPASKVVHARYAYD